MHGMHDRCVVRAFGHARMPAIEVRFKLKIRKACGAGKASSKADSAAHGSRPQETP